MTALTYGNDADLIKGTVVDRTNIGDGKVLAYNLAANKIEYVTSGSGGGGSIGDPVVGGTVGSILFVDGSGNLGQSNANLYWDNTNKRIGINATTPQGSFHVKSNATTEVTMIKQLIVGQTADLFEWRDSSGTVIGDMPVSGAMRLTAGTASNPTYTFFGDQDTGVYWDGATANSLFFSTGGTARAVINSSGQMLVGGTTISASSYAGKLQVMGAAPATGAIDPTTFSVCSTTNGTWTVGQPWGRIDFISNDSSGGADPTDKTHARIELQASATSGGASELVFWVKPGSLAEAFKFTKDAYFQIGAARAAASLAVAGQGTAAVTLFQNLSHGSGDLINLSLTGYSATWTRSTTTATFTVFSTSHLVTGDSVFLTTSSDEQAIPVGAYTITVLTATTYSITCNNVGRVSGSAKLLHNWTRSGSTATLYMSSTSSLHTGMQIYTTDSSSTAAISNFTVFTITVATATTITFTCTNAGATSGYLNTIMTRARITTKGNMILGQLQSGEPSARLQIKTEKTDVIGLMVDAIASQTSDLAQYRDSSNNVLALIDASGRMRTRLGVTTATTVKTGGASYQNFTQTGNTAATETDCFSHSVAANTLGSDGDTLNFSACGTFAATASTDKRIRVKFGATTIYDSGTLAITTANNWSLSGMIIRTGATTQKCFVSITSSSSVLTGSNSYSTAAETLSGAVTFKLTIQGTNASDVVGEFFKENWISAT